MFKKIVLSALAALILCSCSENETEEISVSITSDIEYTETVKAITTSEDEIVTDAEDEKLFEFGHATAETTEATEPSVEETVSVTSEKEHVWSGFSTAAEQEYGYAYVGIDFKFHPEITAEDISEINQVSEGYDSVRCSIDNADMGSLAFLAECKGITYLALNDMPSDVSELVAALEQMNSLEQLYIDTAVYSDLAINDIFKAAPDCRIEYNWYEESEVESDSGYDKCFFIAAYTPCAYSSNNEFGVPETYGTGEDDSIYDELHGMWFCNYTSDDVTVESAEIYYYYNDEWIPVLFSDGSYKKEIGFTAEPMYNIYRYNPYEVYDMPCDFRLDYNNFDFENAKTGRYRLAFTTDKDTVYSDFYINGSTEYDFLTEEQKQVFDDASKVIGRYFSASSYYPNEFPEGGDGDALIREKFCHCLTYDFARKISLGIYIDENGNVIAGGGDRGSNISFDGDYIQPVYIGEDMIVIKRIVVYSHGDYLNDFSVSAHNITMVPTEDGWRVSSMHEYY